MSAPLHIFVIPTGECISCPEPLPNSLDTLRAWIAKSTGVPPEDQILLTTKGKHVKAQSLLTDNEIFLYDRVLFNTSPAHNKAHLAELPEAYTPDPFPDVLPYPNSLKAWQNLFKARRDWAHAVLSPCRSLCRKAESFQNQRVVVDDGLRIATVNHDAHVQNLDLKLKEAEDWIACLEKDAAVELGALERDYQRLDVLPAKTAFGKFFGLQPAFSKGSSRRSEAGECTLAEFIDWDATKSAIKGSKEILKRYRGEINGYTASVQKMGAQFEEFRRGMNIGQSRSLTEEREEPRKILKEIELVVDKVTTACDNVLALRNQQGATVQASKIALLHTKNFLPGLVESAAEMSGWVRHTVEQKNAAVIRAVDHLQMISSIESELANLNKGISAIQLTNDEFALFDRLALPTDLPWLYGNLLIEAVRRNEWIDKMRRDSSSLAEEIAGYQEEEQKRRKKWVRSMGKVNLDSTESKALGVEINLQGSESSWPRANRDDADQYLKDLQQIDDVELVKTLSKILEEIDRPTRQQMKRVKGFKNGSIHEAGFGKGSLLLRGEDEGRVFREANLKLEEELKSHKSRIRKLEDLLHRQQGSRMSVGGASQNSPFPEFSVDPIERAGSVMSPGPLDNAARRPSMSTRRFSATLNQDDKVLSRRIVQLEHDLATERDIRADLERQLAAKKQDENLMQNQLEEVSSIKTDLLENMEAQQREFGNERRALEEEITRFKIRVEEVEDELDRLAGSRDVERNNADKKAEDLLLDLEQTRKNHADQLRNLEANLEAQATAYRVELDHHRTNDEGRREFLTNLYAVLAPGSVAPEDSAKLMAELEQISQRITDHTQDLVQAVSLARSENENLQATLDSQKAEAASLATKLDSREADILKAQEELSMERAKAASITNQLEEERSHLNELRDKFADGETGSESLRQRLAEEESKVIELSSKLAETKSHINSLDVELIALQSKYRQLQQVFDLSKKRLEQRGNRAKEVTHRLYSQNNRLYRLLETLGFAVMHDESGMVIQRASKLGSTSLLTDQSTVNFSSEMPPPGTAPAAPTSARRALDELSDLSSVLWMEKDSSEEEGIKFSEFVAKADRFNVDTFADVLGKRMRDIEHTARKYQRESKAYRDKARKVQTEAHDKIAYRSFKEGDLALFLPTRNQVTRPWAAFNVGAPHYFLREQDAHRLANKEWLVARITKVQEKIVDLSRTIDSARATLASDQGSEAGASTQDYDDDNPFELSDGLRWYLLDAVEEKPGAPSTPGLGKTTVEAANVEARASIPITKKRPGEAGAVEQATKTLSRSLDSRRSSITSRTSGRQIAGALGITRPVSSEALRDSPDGTPSSKAGPSAAAAHLRSASQASSLRQQVLPEERSEDEEAGNASTAIGNGSPSKKALRPPPTNVPASVPVSASNSPSKSYAVPAQPGASLSQSQSATSSPTKKQGKAKSGLWDSLWHFDVSLESGKKK